MTITEIRQELLVLEKKLLALENGTMQPTASQIKINQILKEFIGKRCTLNPSVPVDVQCAEAVSFLLKQLEINDGANGIAGTTALLSFVLANPSLFTEIPAPEESALIIESTGSGNGNLSNGHTGFFGVFGAQYANDWGIVSNDSQTGLLLELWNWTRWQQYYIEYGGMPARMFRLNLPVN